MYLQPDIESDDMMAAELHPIHLKVPTECHRVLAGISAATGDDICTSARQALIEFTRKQLHLATMVVRVSRSESFDGEAGLAPDTDGSLQGKGGAS